MVTYLLNALEDFQSGITKVHEAFRMQQKYIYLL